MKRLRAFAFLGFYAFAAGCSSVPATYHDYLASKAASGSTPQQIRHCRGYGCKFVQTLDLSDADWTQIIDATSPAPKTAEQERERISKTIAAMEVLAGKKSGTSGDEAGTFRHVGPYQLDCIDESTNTTIYLSVLADRGLLKFHDLSAPVMRWPLIDAGHWPHQTAVIVEKSSGKSFAVDSWFHDNGAPAEIIELDKWKEGWKPPSVHGLL